MHELSIASSVVSAVEQARAEQSLGSVALVRLRVGRMSGVLPESLRFCWGQATEHTGLAGAELDIEVTEPQLRCAKCGAATAFESALDRCPACGARGLEIEGGMDLMIESIEIREEEPS